MPGYMQYKRQEIAFLDELGSVSSFSVHKPSQLEFQTGSSWRMYDGDAYLVAAGIKRLYTSKKVLPVIFMMSIKAMLDEVKTQSLYPAIPGILSLFTPPEAFCMERQVFSTNPKKLSSSKIKTHPWKKAKPLDTIFTYNTSSHYNYTEQPVQRMPHRMSTPQLVPEFANFIEQRRLPLDEVCNAVLHNMKMLESNTFKDRYVDNLSYQIAIPQIPAEHLFGHISQEKIVNGVKSKNVEFESLLLLQAAKIQALIVREAFWRQNRDLGNLAITFKTYTEFEGSQEPLPKYLQVRASITEPRLMGIDNILELDIGIEDDSFSFLQSHVNRRKEQK